MDVNATLARIRELTASTDPDHLGDLVELAELVRALDEWISKGGFLPDAWQRGLATERTAFTRGSIAYTRHVPR